MLINLINGIFYCLDFFKNIIKNCIIYGSILFCSCLKEKCLKEENKINENEIIVSSPTPLLINNNNNNQNKHKVLEAFENKLINDINNT